MMALATNISTLAFSNLGLQDRPLTRPQIRTSVLLKGWSQTGAISECFVMGPQRDKELALECKSTHCFLPESLATKKCQLN